ncbi:MAG TPA: acyl carrier protein [Planctomycetes bacterium]|nr:acyl carrier protein [Planctomycetota bacterium]
MCTAILPVAPGGGSGAGSAPQPASSTRRTSRAGRTPAPYRPATRSHLFAEPQWRQQVPSRLDHGAIAPTLRDPFPGEVNVSEIRTKVIDIIADRLSRDKATITDGSDLVADLGADSLDVAEVTMDLEDAFGVKIEEEKAQSLKTIGDIVKAISEKVAAK